MDAGRNQLSRHNAKLLQVNDSVNPQILDYYKRFGQNRDLEQYFFSHGTGKSCTSSSVYTDATEFATARCMSAEDDHTRCQQKALIMKEILSKSLNSEIKKQQNTSFKSLNFNPFGQKIQLEADDCTTKATGDTALLNENMAKQFSPPKNTSDRSEWSNKYGGEMGDDEIQMDQSATKLGSPSSSATRRLEWDSLADVGYANAELGGFSEQNLSTLERMALRSRYKCKEGDKDQYFNTNQNIDLELQNVAKMGLPNAQSTPELDKDNVATTYSIKRKINIKAVPGRKSNRKTVLKHKNTGIYKLDYTHNTGSTNVNIDMTKKFSFDLQKVDENFNRNDYSKLNTNVCTNFASIDNNKTAEVPKTEENPSRLYDITNSNDSKSTVTAETSTSNKEIQTSFRDSVSTSAQTLQTNEDGTYALTNILSKTPIILNVLRKTSKLKTKGRRRNEPSFKIPDRLYTLPVKETAESYQSDNELKETSENYDIDSPAKCSESILTQAESFEYMPGNMYLNKDITSQDQSPNTGSIPESSHGLASTDPGSFPTVTSSNGSSKNPADLLKFLELSSSFTRDLNSSVDIIGKLINIRHKDPELKKKLIKKVVKILVKNDYPDDENSEILPASDDNKLTPGKTSVEKTSSDDIEKSPIDEKCNNQNVELSENITIESQPKQVNPNLSSTMLPVQKSLTANIPLNDKLVYNSSRQVKSAPVSLSYSDYLEHKAKSSHLVMKNNEIENVSESHSSNSKNVLSLFTDKDCNTDKKTKQSTEISGSMCTIFSSTPKISSSNSNVDKKMMKTKSEKIYEQYLLVKKQEEQEYKQQLKNDILMKKKRDLRKQDVALSLLKNSKAYAPSSISTNDTPKQLAVINEEILQLTILKLKLENKHVPENLDLLKGGSGRSPLTTKPLTDDGASGDRGFSAKLPSDIQDLNPPIPTYYSLTNSPASSRNRKYNHVPPLNLMKSTDESCENTLSNVEELDSCQYSYVRDGNGKNDVSKRASSPDTKNSQRNLVCVGAPECSKNLKTVLRPLSCMSRNNNQSNEIFQSASNAQKKSDCVDVPECSKNVKTSLRPISAVSRISNENKDKYQYSQKTESSQNKDSNCKCGKVCFHCQTPQISYKTPKSSSDHSGSDKYDDNPGILCPCCRSNLISSSSSTSEYNKKTSRTVPDVSRELRKLEKVFEKYQKCKILQSFMKEYDDLVMKYTLMKDAQVTESGCCPSSGENKRCKESHRPRNESKKEAVPNEPKKQPTLRSVHMVKQSMDSCESDNNVMDRAKIAESIYRRKCAARQNVDNFAHSHDPYADLKLTGDSNILGNDPTVKLDEIGKKSPVRRMTQVENKQMAFVDANTSPVVTPRQKYNYDNFRRLMHQEVRKCIDVGTSPISDKEDGNKCSDSRIDNSKSSKIPDYLIHKVRKAFSKEYEDIIKRYEGVKSEHCLNCKHKKSSSKPLNDCQPKVNEVNVGESEPYTTTSSRKATKSKDKSLSSKAVDYQDKHNKKATNTVGVCPICNVSPVIIGLKICVNCAKKHKGSNKIKKQDNARIVCVPKPIAYNLIVESSESILEETIQNKRASLEEIIVKVPKLRSKNSHQKNGQEALRVLMSVDEEKGSTDEQIKEFSSLNNDFSDDSSSPSSCPEISDKDNEVPSKCSPKKYNLTVSEFLHKRRPDFVNEANRRQECLKRIHGMRQQREVELRKLFSLGVSCLPNLKQIKLSDLECIAMEHGILLPKHNGKRIFDSNEMVRRTTRQYMKLPEILNKKYDLRREEYKKTNLLRADLFAKKLKEKTLKGYVNIAHCSSVISI